MKRVILLFIYIWITFAAHGKGNHKREERPDDHKINVGIGGGFNSSMFLVSNLRIKDITIDEIQNNYKIGYFGVLFMHFNMKRHLMQPEVSYNISRCETTFDKLGLQYPDIEPDYASVNPTIHSVDFPLPYGYHAVRQGLRSMPLFAGSKLRYLWDRKNKITLENFDQQGIHESLRPFNASVVIEVSVSISRIFFDFRYGQGPHNPSKSVIYDNIGVRGKPEVSNITFQCRDNILSFSFEVIF